MPWGARRLSVSGRLASLVQVQPQSAPEIDSITIGSCHWLTRITQCSLRQAGCWRRLVICAHRYHFAAQTRRAELDARRGWRSRLSRLVSCNDSRISRTGRKPDRRPNVAGRYGSRPRRHSPPRGGEREKELAQQLAELLVRHLLIGRPINGSAAVAGAVSVVAGSANECKSLL